MKLNKILVPFDFSVYSDLALEVASSLARYAGGTVHIVHVKEPLAVYHVQGKYDVNPYGDLEQLKKTLTTVRPKDPEVSVQHWLMTGDVVHDILLLAEEQNVDLIVMATHGRTGLRRVLMGSIAESVLRNARCPVLIVKAPETSNSQLNSG